MMVAINPNGRVDGFIYRIGMPDQAIVRVLEKYGIEADTEGDPAKCKENRYLISRCTSQPVYYALAAPCLLPCGIELVAALRALFQE